MKKYIHYNFDLWDTLIKSNPKTIELRNNLVSEKLNCPVDTVRDMYSEVKRYHDFFVEENGVCLSPLFLSKYICKSLVLNCSDYDSLAKEVVEIQNKCILENPPFVIDNVHDVLYNVINNKRSCTLICNTGFIGGETLRKVLCDLGISKYMSYMWFSDEFKYAKPNRRIFEVLQFYASLYDCNFSDIVHVGDNIITDGAARNLGFDFYHITKETPINQLP